MPEVFRNLPEAFQLLPLDVLQNSVYSYPREEHLSPARLSMTNAAELLFAGRSIRTVLVQGPESSGKSYAAYQLLHEAAKAKKPQAGLFLITDNPFVLARVAQSQSQLPCPIYHISPATTPPQSIAQQLSSLLDRSKKPACVIFSDEPEVAEFLVPIHEKFSTYLILEWLLELPYREEDYPDHETLGLNYATCPFPDGCHHPVLPSPEITFTLGGMIGREQAARSSRSTIPYYISMINDRRGKVCFDRAIGLHHEQKVEVRQKKVLTGRF